MNTDKKPNFWQKAFWKETKWPEWLKFSKGKPNPKMKPLNRWLAVSIFLFLMMIFFIFFAEGNNWIKDIYFLAITNLPIAIGFVVLLITFFIWVRNRKVNTEKALIDGKVAMILALAGFAIFLCYRNVVNLTEMQRQRIVVEWKQKIDSVKTEANETVQSTLSSYKKDDERALKLSEEKAKKFETELEKLRQTFDSVVVASNLKEVPVKQSSSSDSGGFTGKDKIWLFWLLVILAIVSLASLLFKDFTWIPIKARRDYVGIPALVLAAVVLLWVKFFPDFFVWKHGNKEPIAQSEPVKKKIEITVPVIVQPPPQPVDTTTVVETAPEEKKQDVVETPKVDVKKKVAPKKKFRYYKPPNEERLIRALNAKKGC